MSHFYLCKIWHFSYSVDDVDQSYWMHIPIKLFEIYSTNILQYVELNDDIASRQQKTHYWCTTRVFTRPLCFLIHMNHILNVSQAFKFIWYAGDTTLFTTITYSIPIRMSNVDESLNNELSQFINWLVINELSLSTSNSWYFIHTRNI